MSCNYAEIQQLVNNPAHTHLFLYLMYSDLCQIIPVKDLICSTLGYPLTKLSPGLDRQVEIWSKEIVCS